MAATGQLADSQIIPFSKGRVLLDGDKLARLSAAEFENLAADDSPRVYLGASAEGVACYALEVNEADLAPLGEFTGARSAMALISGAEMPLLARGRAVLAWHTTHQYCGVCGTASAASDDGTRRQCPSCGHEVYPRVDPVCIFTVTRANHILLARKDSWPRGRFSTLAGFVEAGETAEAAVSRECLEEVGVSLSDVTYSRSQAWPFPSQLMLGFHATASSDAITLDPQELAQARWFTRSEINDALNREPDGIDTLPSADIYPHARVGSDIDEVDAPLTLPPPFAVSRQLIEEWLSSNS